MVEDGRVLTLALDVVLPVWPLMKAIRSSRAQPGAMNGGVALRSLVPQSGDGTPSSLGARVTSSIAAAVGLEESNDV